MPSSVVTKCPSYSQPGPIKRFVSLRFVNYLCNHIYVQMCVCKIVKFFWKPSTEALAQAFAFHESFSTLEKKLATYNSFFYVPRCNFYWDNTVLIATPLETSFKYSLPLSISTTLYLELFSVSNYSLSRTTLCLDLLSVSNWGLRPLGISSDWHLICSPWSRTSLSRTFFDFELDFVPLALSMFLSLCRTSPRSFIKWRDQDTWQGLFWVRSEKREKLQQKESSRSKNCLEFLSCIHSFL